MDKDTVFHHYGTVVHGVLMIDTRLQIRFIGDIAQGKENFLLTLINQKLTNIQGEVTELNGLVSEDHMSYNVRTNPY